MNDVEAGDFTAFVAARSPALLRTAYLLTGSDAAAEDLLQTALLATRLAEAEAQAVTSRWSRPNPAPSRKRTPVARG